MSSMTQDVTVETSGTALAAAQPSAATTPPPAVAPATPRRGLPEHLARMFETLGLDWFAPLVLMLCGREPLWQVRRLLRQAGLPLLAIALFLTLWHGLSTVVRISGTSLPGPVQVAAAAGQMHADWRQSRNAHAQWRRDLIQAQAENPTMSASELRQIMPWTGAPTYPDKILTSLGTVFTGFLLGTLVAVPLGILCGMSPTAFAMVNPFIQVFKPISPVAWLPIVSIIVGAAASGGADGASGGAFGKSFIIAALVVALCSLWPTLINTANGVANVERDWLNIARMLNLPPLVRIWRVILPAALPHIFNGMRLSIGVGWMVLIAAEILAQNPGLGGFVWDVFQSSNRDALALIMVAALTIGVIGFVLDRAMVAVQRLATRGTLAAVR